jgi:hypothetical protein
MTFPLMVTFLLACVEDRPGVRATNPPPPAFEVGPLIGQQVSAAIRGATRGVSAWLLVSDQPPTPGPCVPGGSICADLLPTRPPIPMRRMGNDLLVSSPVPAGTCHLWFQGVMRGPSGMTFVTDVVERLCGDADLDGVRAPSDCDDADPDVFPQAPEVCGDGVDSDCDGADLPCPRLLFRSGFEAGVTLSTSCALPVQQHAGVLSPTRTGSQQLRLCGGDVPGSVWEQPAWGTDPPFLNAIVDAGVLAAAYLDTRIVDITDGPRGQTTRALFLNKLGAPPVRTLTSQVTLVYNFTSATAVPPEELYLRYWIRLDEQLLMDAATPGYWRLIAEYKSYGMPVIHREQAMLYAHSRPGSAPEPYLLAIGNYQDSSTPPRWLVDYHAPDYDPVPLGTWVPFELHLRYRGLDDDRFTVALGSEVLADHVGPSTGAAAGVPLGSLFANKIYGAANDAPQWIDDLEIWDRPPCDALPCGPPP